MHATHGEACSCRTRAAAESEAETSAAEGMTGGTHGSVTLGTGGGKRLARLGWLVGRVAGLLGRKAGLHGKKKKRKRAAAGLLGVLG
jgi:hypothetical protein